MPTQPRLFVTRHISFLFQRPGLMQNQSGFWNQRAKPVSFADKSQLEKNFWRMAWLKNFTDQGRADHYCRPYLSFKFRIPDACGNRAGPYRVSKARWTQRASYPLQTWLPCTKLFRERMCKAIGPFLIDCAGETGQIITIQGPIIAWEEDCKSSEANLMNRNMDEGRAGVRHDIIN